jgi:glutaredoxin-like YruB-family protein
MHIKVYSTPTCPYCSLVKEFLQEKSLKFEEVDVAANAEAAKEMVKISGQMGVPVIEIDGQIIVGWNRQALEDVVKA